MTSAPDPKILAMNHALYDLDKAAEELVFIARASWVSANAVSGNEDCSTIYARSTLEKAASLKLDKLQRVWSAWSAIHSLIPKAEPKAEPKVKPNQLSALASLQQLEEVMLNDPSLSVEEAIGVVEHTMEPPPAPPSSPVPKKPNYNHHYWPSPRPKLFARALGAKVRGHEDSLVFLANKAGITVNALLQMNPLVYESNYMYPTIGPLDSSASRQLFAELPSGTVVRRSRYTSTWY